MNKIIMNLAIKGHRTRGGEVVQLLEMLGGKSNGNMNGYNDDLYYYIAKDGLIYGSGIEYEELAYNYTIFSLEEFEKLYPYKVADRVSSKYLQNYKIEKIEWEDTNNRVIYKLQGMGWYSADELQPYKEEIMEERKYADLRLDVDQDDKLATEATIDGDKITPPENYLIGKITKVDNGVLVEFVKKQPQYPKDYEECCKVLGYSGNYNMILTTDIDCKLFNALYRLKVCRDAYWKKAGKQMGLEKPWKPDWNDVCDKYTIYIVYGNEIWRDKGQTINTLLAFPTAEMRDVFYENFKDLIEQCKELL